ncbi:hypothetical protein [Aeromonas salmonicida]|uniref:hypothetical protein n=1 Tax=Aeromonas salmonicida TaxID=645 RepID=UPI001260021D|nr:hypothetical protein [Aeromonas salmonicida]ELI6433157.1 hypothetical protein [Aeromonas salmonicida subsp. salmonicida]
MFTQYNNGPFMGRFLFFMGCRYGAAWQAQERFFLWAVFCFLRVAVAVVLGRYKNGSFYGPFFVFYELPLRWFFWSRVWPSDE